MPRSRALLLTATVVGLAALTGCSSLGIPDPRPFDEVQELRASSDVTLGIRILDTEVQDPSVLDGLTRTGGESAYSVPVFVSAEVTLVEGSLEGDPGRILDGNGWHGRGEDGKAAEGLSVIGVLEACPGFGRDEAETLMADGRVEICALLLAQTDAEMTEVGFGALAWRDSVG